MKFYENCVNEKNGGAKRQKSGTWVWRYKTSTWRFLLREKYKKQRFFMKRTSARIAWQQLFTAKRFLTKSYKLDCFNMSCLAALKARHVVSRKFPETYHRPEKLRVQYIHACHTIHNYEFKIKKRDEQLP